MINLTRGTTIISVLFLIMVIPFRVGGYTLNSAYSVTGLDWSILEVITASNIGRLTNLQTANLGNNEINDLISFYDGQILTIAVDHDTNQLSLLKAQSSGVSIQNLKLYTAIIVDMAFLPTRDILGITAYSGGIELWDINNGVNILTLDPEWDYTTLTFHPQSEALVTGSFDSITEWNLDSGLEIHTFVILGVAVEDIVFAPNGNLLALGTGTGVTIVDWQNRQDLIAPISDTSNREVVFNRNGDILAFISEVGQEAGLWDMDTSSRILIKEGGDDTPGNDIEFNLDGQLFMIASADGLEVYNGYTGSYITTLNQFTSEITTLSISNDGRFLVTGHVNGEVNIWGVPPEVTATPTPLPCTYNPLTATELITAIQTANGTPEQDTICLAQNGTYSFSAIYSYRNGLPRISSDIKIVGNGATLTRQSGVPQFRFFEVRSTGNLTLENLTLTGGSLNADYDGGAIFNLGTLTANNVTFSNNQAGVGGAIVSEDGQVTVTDSTFTNNASTGDGGAIHSEADLLIETSTFAGNTADDAGAVNNDGGTLTVTDSTFTDNSADDGGAIYNDAGTLTLSGSTFTDNSGDAGGALDNLDGQAQIDSSTFTGNSASDGGAIRNYGGTVILTTSAFTGNTATDDGGALNNSGGTLTITDTRLENNTATTRGGAIYSNSSGTMSAHNSCISGNSATAVYAASTGLQDFTGNWWGAANGPGGAGPGSGDTINSKINHASFLTAGCPLP